MNEEQITKLLKAVSISKNCLIIITVCTLLITIYTGFELWKNHLPTQQSSDARFRRELWRAQQKGAFHDVVALASTKLESEPRNVWIRFQLGAAQFHLEQWQDSIDTMTQVIQHAPNMKEQVTPFIEKAQANLSGNESPQ